MDQAAPSDQSILWDFGECRKDPNLDCDFGLCACRYYQEAHEN
jgi:hypothetical protein